jgi:hypothetical protein
MGINRAIELGYNFTELRFLARKNGSERMVVEPCHCDICRRELKPPEMYYLVSQVVGYGVQEETLECVDCASMQFCS